MAAAEIKIGRYYAATVSGKLTIVKIEAGSSRGSDELLRFTSFD